MRELSWWPNELLPGYLIAGAISAAVGIGDILSRYKNNPWGALGTRAALAFVAANLLFGMAAFWFTFVVNAVELSVGEPGTAKPTAAIVRDGIVVGFAAVLILRAVAFNLNIGGKANQVGPSAIVDTLLAACDQSIDRKLACEKDAKVRRMMAGISFEAAKTFIPAYCLSLIQNTQGIADNMGALITSIEKIPGLTDKQRSFLLGSTLVNIFGHGVAFGAIEGFKPELKNEASPLHA